jgi:F-box-like
VKSVRVLLFCCIEFLPRGASTKMSLSSYNQPNQLTDDILLRIFDELDGEDWLQCEAVCHQWQNVLISGTRWRRLFHQKIVSSPQWRQLLWDLGVDEKKLQTVHYIELCKVIIQEVKKLDANWRTGNFKKSSKNLDFVVYHYDGRNGNHCFALYCSGWSSRDISLKFFDRTSLEVQSSIDIPFYLSAVTNTEIVVSWGSKNVKILDLNGQLISEVSELIDDERISWNLTSCCLSDDQMAVISQNDGQEKLSLWDVSNPSEAIRLKSRCFNLNLQLNREFSITMDKQFIAVSTLGGGSIYFFSKETLDLHWQKTADENVRNNFSYDQGILTIPVSDVNDGLIGIEMYDVKSRKCFRQTRTTVKSDRKYRCLVGFNSKFMVVVHGEHSVKSELIIYDLEKVKNSTEDELLVHTLPMDTDFCNLVVSEIDIFIVGKMKIHRFDFGTFECFRNAAKSVTLSLPWRGVWRSKGVDEEPLEPVHHMEIYREVLKYFHQLSKNCQTAMKCYPVDDLYLAMFTLGDDFFGYVKPNQKMIVYDEHMDKRSHEMDNESIQISQTSHLSVMGKTIQLIDSSTGNVIEETKLEREIVFWHFSCHLLVCVFKIAEFEHLLSIWRIEHSSNLTHIKDVAIGGYDGLLQVDEQFIAVKTHSEENAETKTFNFISMKTFQVERSLSSRAEYFEYDEGLLFLLKDDLFRILDVASGTFLRDIRMEPGQLDSIFCSANSNYFVTSAIECSRERSKLFVYDLKCLKETDAVPSHLLLTTIDLECQVKEMLMNETRIVCLSDHEMYVVDLKPIDRLRCPNLVD